MKWRATSSQNIIAFLQSVGSIDASGKFLRKVLEANLCRVNGRVERFGSTRLEKGDWVELAPEWQELAKVAPLQFPILYEDALCQIVDKPAGWVCSDPSCRKTFGPKLFLVHRLDKDTTGALLLAKGLQAREELMALFAARQVDKEYIALVDGLVRENKGVRESFLAKKRLFEGQTIWSQGEEAITFWEVLQRGKDATYVRCQPLTGRTHQIRVHMAELSHPLIVDRQYGEKLRSRYFAKRPLLHAQRLRFTVDGTTVDVRAPLPEDLLHVALRAGIAQPHALL
ncbi:MAG: RluA family pseudouridine synthase [Chlamydiia bacterium]|nr:RluA family pseudouridine synthase [Chlamydiia bacterium]